MATSSASASKLDLEKLEYAVHKFSSYSPNYHPCNIQEDKPEDQASRWSSDSNNPPQFLMLKLSKFAVVHTIKFGKYEKTHVCNLKKFKVYGGLEEDHMLELLEAGLKNDSKPETFFLRHKVGGKPFACRYLKIVPIQSWGSSFNFTVWYVELSGNTDWHDVKDGIHWLSKHRENETVRFCMKFLRQMNYTAAFNSLKQESNISLEHPALSELFDIVSSGEYLKTEQFMDSAVQNGMLNSYISKLDYKPSWKSINTDRPRPGMRGGHQMCLDSYSDTIFLLGGWDGHHDLSDFWSYHVSSNTWTTLSTDTKADGGPSARSCHKVCVDPERRQIFVLGRYLDIQFRTAGSLKSDFYVYNIESNEWTKITDDTSAMGGPKLIFDHQMCIDVKKRIIYVFGGRVLQPAPISGEVSTHQEPVYSGLYSYHVSTNTWLLISTEHDTLIRSRVGHSMLFHPIYRKLYVFAGQRNKDYLNDFFSYDVDSGAVEQISEGFSRDCANLPAAGFTHRATIDPDLDEIYVLSGLSKDKDKRDDQVQNSFWVYYIQQNKWVCVYKSEVPNVQYWNKTQTLEPCPRFAHQVVYDSLRKVHYLFGGNPGMSCLPKLRLDDFWKLTLLRPSNPQLIRQCKILIRKYKFKELSYTNMLEAMIYLQSSLYEVIDHTHPVESSEFAKLPTVMFETNTCRKHQSLNHEIYLHRTKLFDELATFFPESMTQPRASLYDIVPL